MTAPFLAIGFGLVVIAMIFLTVVFFRAWRDPHPELDRRYRVVSSALMLGAAAVGMWAVNPLKQALGFGGLSGVTMFVSSTLLFAASVTLIGSTILNGSRTTLLAFVVTSIIWTFGILTWAFLL